MRHAPKPLFLSLLLAVGPALADGAPPAPDARPATVPGAPSLGYETLHVGAALYLETLRAWSARRPDRTIASIASVLAYRSGASDFVLGTVPGDGRSQRFDELTWPNKGPTDADLAEFDRRHPDRRIVAFTTIASYSGGIGSFVVVSLPR